MKLSKISTAFVAAFGALSTSAFALPANQFDANTVNVRISGATAQDGGVANAVLAICVPGTTTVYTSSNQFVYFCTPNAFANLPATATKLAVYKHSFGGSGNGVTPINSGDTLPFLNLASIASSACFVATSTATSVNCSTVSGISSPGFQAAIGISDVEPAFFGAPSTYAALASEPLATVIFGVPVTRNVYEKLQAAQGIVNVGSLLAADMPNITTGQMTSLYVQEGQTWNDVFGTDLNLDGDNNPATEDPVYVARRVDTSGTQKTYEAIIARTPNTDPTAKNCQVGTDPFVGNPSLVPNNDATANAACNGANQVINNSGSQQVLRCMAALNDASRGAVGTLTTETLTLASTSSTVVATQDATKIRFLKVNGLAPTTANVKAGAYTFYGDATLNTNSANYGPFDAVVLAGLKSKFAIIPVAQPFGNAGLVELNVVTGLTTGNPFNRIVGGAQDNCQQGRLSF